DTNRVLKSVQFTGTIWNPMTLAETKDQSCLGGIADALCEQGARSSIALGLSGKLHIAFESTVGGTPKIFYGLKAPNLDWQIEEVTTGRAPSIVVDSDGGVDIAYLDVELASDTNGPIGFLKRSDQTWINSEIVPDAAWSPDPAAGFSLQLNRANDTNIRLVYTNATDSNADGGLELLNYDSENWTSELTIPGAKFGLLAQSSGSPQPYLVYTESGTGGDTLRYAPPNGDGIPVPQDWLDSLGDTVTNEIPNSFQVDSNNQPHLITFAPPGGLHYRFHDATDWYEDPFAGEEASLLLDGDDVPHMAVRSAGDDLSYRERRSPSELSRITDNTNSVNGTFSSHVDARDVPRVSYFEFPGGLHYAEPRTTQGWVSTEPINNATMDYSGTVSSVRTSGDETQLVFYSSDVSNPSFVGYAWRAGGVWQEEKIVHPHKLGPDMNLLEGIEPPTAVLVDTDDDNVLIATRVGAGNWSFNPDTETPPEVVSVDSMSSVADVNQNVYAAYVDYRAFNDQHLRAAMFIDGEWIDEEVSEYSGYSDRPPVIKIDYTTGEPVIGFFSSLGSHQGLYFARRNGTDSWTVESTPSGFTQAFDFAMLVSTPAFVAEDSGAVSTYIRSGAEDDPWVSTSVAIDCSSIAGLRILPGRTLRIHYHCANVGRLFSSDALRELLVGSCGDFVSCSISYCLFELEDGIIFGRRKKAIARGVAPPLDLDSSLDVFRAFRNKALLSGEGQRLTNLYYANTGEVSLIAVADPALLTDTWKSMENWWVGTRAWVESRGDDIIITQTMVDDLNDVCDRFVAAGSPALDTAIDGERGKYDGLQDWVGLNFNEWALLIGIESQQSEIIQQLLGQRHDPAGLDANNDSRVDCADYLSSLLP
ncbi:MAG: hypothetical protein ABI579_06080, partial [Candidatus Sumerlaeota bacterium]